MILRGLEIFFKMFIVFSDRGGDIYLLLLWYHKKILLLAEVIAGQRSAI